MHSLEDNGSNGWNPKDSYAAVGIGVGPKALRMRSLARDHPDWNVLGIDKKDIEPSSQANLELIVGDAGTLLTRLPSVAVDRVYMDCSLYCLSDDEASALLSLLKDRLIVNGEITLQDPRIMVEKDQALLQRFGFRVTPAVIASPSDISFSPAAAYKAEFVEAARAINRGENGVHVKEAWYSSYDGKYWKTPGLLEPMTYTARVSK